MMQSKMIQKEVLNDSVVFKGDLFKMNKRKGTFELERTFENVIKLTSIKHNFSKEEINEMRKDVIDCQIDVLGVEKKYDGIDSNEFLREQTKRFNVYYNDECYVKDYFEKFGINRYISKMNTEIHPMWLAKEITLPYAKAWMPSITKDGSTKDIDFISQQAFVLDFDNGITIEKVLERCEQYNVYPNFIHTTFSHTEEHQKFRVVFIDDFVHTNIVTRNIVVEGLTKIFPEADKMTNTLGTIVQGGKEIVFENYSNKINVKIILEAVSMYLKDIKNKTNYKRDLQRFAKKTHVELDSNGFFNIDLLENDLDNITPTPYIYNNRTGQRVIQTQIKKINRNIDDNKRTEICFLFSNNRVENFSIIINLEESVINNIELSIKAIKPIIEYDDETRKYIDDLKNCKDNKICEMCKRCKAMEVIENDDDHLDYQTRMIVASNVRFLRGGQTWFLDKMETTSQDYEVSARNWEYQFNYMKKYESGYSCKSKTGNYQCQYYDECSDSGMIIFLLHKRNKITRYEKPELKDRDFTREEITDTVNRIMVNNDKKLHIIKAETGIGKTYTYTRLAQKYNLCITIPRHNVADEVEEELQKLNVPYMRALDLNKYLDCLTKEEKIEYDLRYLKGLGSEANYYLAKLAQDKDYKDLLSALEHNAKVAEFNGTIIITHSKDVYMNECKQDYKIIDEDYFLTNSMIKTNSTTIEELTKLFDHVWDSSDIHNKVEYAINFISNAKENTLIKFDFDFNSLSSVYANIISDESIKSNVLDLFSSKYFYRNKNHVHYINVIDEEIDKTTILFSATASEYIYKKFYNYINFHDFGYIKHIGTINQYVKYSNSRNCLNTNEKAVAYLEEQMPLNTNLITFKAFKEKYNAVANFGGCSGLNEFEGQDLVVLGTPHIQEGQIFLYAKAFGIEFNEEDMIMRYQLVRYQGYEFYFMTYKHEGLRMVQFYFIESELLQAVGRARTMNNKCKVEVFSNFPIIQANIMDKTVVNNYCEETINNDVINASIEKESKENEKNVKKVGNRFVTNGGIPVLPQYVKPNGIIKSFDDILSSKNKKELGSYKITIDKRDSIFNTSSFVCYIDDDIENCYSIFKDDVSINLEKGCSYQANFYIDSSYILKDITNIVKL